MKKLIYSLGLLFLFSCQNNTSKQEKQQEEESNTAPTHYVTCSKVHVRAEPNPAAESKGLLSENQKVSYQKESDFKEIIAIKGRQQPQLWYYVAYSTPSEAKAFGWIYAGCLGKLPNAEWKPVVDEKIYLANRHILKALKSDCQFEVEQCTVDCGCDCCTDDLYFLTDGHVIMESFCCCDNPTVYMIGKYRSAEGEIFCRFQQKCVLDSIGIEGVSSSALPVYDVTPSFSFTFSRQLCGNDLFMMEEEKDETVAIFTQDLGVAEYVANLKRKKIYEMLYKLLDQK